MKRFFYVISFNDVLFKKKQKKNKNIANWLKTLEICSCIKDIAALSLKNAAKSV